jgi:histidyl-tRNA synthetase
MQEEKEKKEKEEEKESEKLIRTLKGTRDYLPEQQLIREAIVDVLKKNFKKYGYMPVETSILDFYDIATRKCGKAILEEIYRLRDRANRDLCLRYELTFKLAKLMAKQIALPFKRYEIGKVFRDGPITTARLREFTQCDVDCVGISGAMPDAELIALAFSVFDDLGLDVSIQVNNRKLLNGLLYECEIESEKMEDAMIALDKLEKHGKKAVIEEMKEKGISEESIKKVFSYFDATAQMSNEEKIEFFGQKLKSKEATEGLDELKEFFYYCKLFIKDKKKLESIVFVPSLVRGFAYYTGLVYEAYLKNSEIKRSVAGGGRWDKLISDFLQTSQQYPATGISFGLDVIYEAVKEKMKKTSNLILIIPVTKEKKIEASAISLAQWLREKEFCVDIMTKPLSKALEYANKKGIKHCIIIGPKELEKKKYRLRDMESGKEVLLSKAELAKFLKKRK